MNERSLEDRLMDAMLARFGDGVAFDIEDVRLAISTALTLARREGYLSGLRERSSHLKDETLVKATDFAFPLPTRPVDPNEVLPA